jgi:hypothetical protein
MKKHTQSTERKPSPVAPPAPEPAKEPDQEDTYGGKTIGGLLIAMADASEAIYQSTRRLRAELLALESQHSMSPPLKRALDLVNDVEHSAGFLDLEVLQSHEEVSQ